MEGLGFSQTTIEFFTGLCPQVMGIGIGAGFLSATVLSLLGYGIFKALSLINIRN